MDIVDGILIINKNRARPARRMAMPTIWLEMENIDSYAVAAAAAATFTLRIVCMLLFPRTHIGRGAHAQAHHTDLLSCSFALTLVRCGNIRMTIAVRLTWLGTADSRTEQSKRNDSIVISHHSRARKFSIFRFVCMCECFFLHSPRPCCVLMRMCMESRKRQPHTAPSASFVRNQYEKFARARFVCSVLVNHLIWGRARWDCQR